MFHLSFWIIYCYMFITRWSHQKHMGVVLDSNLNFNTHIDNENKKCNKMIGLIRWLSGNLPCSALLTTYKSFIRPHLDYGDILYDKPNNKNFQTNKLKFSKSSKSATLSLSSDTWWNARNIYRQTLWWIRLIFIS